MKYLPLFINFNQKPVLIIGGGNVAFRKIYLLKKTGAIIRIVADTLCPALQKNLLLDKVIWIGKIFQPVMLDNIYLIIIATNDPNLNSTVFYHAEKRRILVNTVDDQSKCSCIFPAIISRAPVIIGISSCGTAPVLVRMLREKLESLLPMFLGSIASIAGIWRSRVRRHITDLKSRRRFWEKLFYNSHFYSLIEQGNFRKAHKMMQYLISINNYNNNKRGNVTLVGAGPGDIGLLTIRGLQVMQQADVILYDHLINADILDLARRDSDKICVGKFSGKHLVSQKQINHLMIQLAQDGNNVVRLKGGDAFIFGRGGEELQAISKAGITFQVVPGITAAIGAAAYAGIPLTHREYSHGVTFITGHKVHNNNKINWSALSGNDQTLVVYMGRNNAMNISKNLIFYGRHIDTPVAIISRGTYQNQKVLIGTLIELDKLVLMADSPILLIIGNVVSLHKKTHWFDNQTHQSLVTLI